MPISPKDAYLIGDNGDFYINAKVLSQVALDAALSLGPFHPSTTTLVQLDAIVALREAEYRTRPIVKE